MDVEGDIVLLSIPFAAGVALAAFLPLKMLPYAETGSSLAAAAACLALYSRAKPRSLMWIPLYLLLGFFCYCSSSLGGLSSGIQDKTGIRLEAFLQAIDSCGFKDSTSALLKALLAGRKENLSADTLKSFRESGASHILALSGLHLGIIYGLLLKATAVFGNGRAVSAVRSAAVTASCGTYCLLTGMSPSICRAFIFIVINEIARHQSGRRRKPLAVLCAALVVQLAVNPRVITSTGFQLSYLAMTGITLIYPKLETFFPADGGTPGPMRRIWLSAAMSVSCQITTAPLVWLRFHSFPKYFLLTNLLALPLTEVLMIESIACIVLSASGVCPAFAVRAADKLAELLQFVLEAISGM